MNLTIKGRVALTSGLLSLFLAGIGALGLYGMGDTNVALANVATNEMPGMLAIANSTVYASRERLSFDLALQEIGTSAAAGVVERHNALREKSDGYWKTFMGISH